MDVEGEKGIELRLLDILRYRAPRTFPEEVDPKIIEAFQEYLPLYLLDIYFVKENTPMYALLHPDIYPRIYKGWLKVGSLVRVTEMVSDMVTRLELIQEEEETEEYIRLKRELYQTAPTPLYAPAQSYIPLLSDDEYTNWDIKWSRALEPYLETEENIQIISKEDFINEDVEQSPVLQRKRRLKDRIAYSNTKNNVVKGIVLLKSMLFQFYKENTSTPLVFSFILLMEDGPIKVFVWESAVKKFFCLSEGDHIIIKGFKVKRRNPISQIVDRTLSDLDTRYGTLPEISVNYRDPVGSIMELSKPLEGIKRPTPDKEFTTVCGVVEYISSLFRERLQGTSKKRIREFLYLQVSGVSIKLFSNGVCGDLLKIRAGQYIDIRHLRECYFGSFVFFISSIYTVYYLERMSLETSDYSCIEKTPNRHIVENGIGYIPVTHRTYNDYINSSKEGLGILRIRGNPISPTSPHSEYLKRDITYYGKLLSLSDLKEKAEALYVDEVVRVVVPGRISSIRYQNRTSSTEKEEESTGDMTSLEISYMQTELSLNAEEVSFSSEGASHLAPAIEESVLLRIKDTKTHIDVYLFQNHLLFPYSFDDSVLEFLKMPKDSGSPYHLLQKIMNVNLFFVIDVVRISFSTILYIGISVLK
ncbi:hypothetical protein NEFER03_1045 [Nematocida sp. LUAm3]|nr:hypothetical protein NEFER03_1045 [Nematocida sp. LUAm3]KAI5175351.1 hypothetical protein NEFER02_1280 [Nematocida sp. LUAm2]KAI5177692.1 hypothetical protein NEFER01_0916 [Nematocida sp. LUAm1]